MKTRVSFKYLVTDRSLKSEIDKLDIGKSEATPVDLSKLWDVVYDEFNAIKIFNAVNLIKKISEIEKEILDLDHNNKYITTQKFKKFTAEDFAARLKQANWTAKADIDDFVEKTDFDYKLKNLNKTFTSNNTKYIEARKKLIDLTKNVKQISEEEYNFLLGIMNFTGDTSYQNS